MQQGECKNAVGADGCRPLIEDVEESWTNSLIHSPTWESHFTGSTESVSEGVPVFDPSPVQIENKLTRILDYED